MGNYLESSSEEFNEAAWHSSEEDFSVKLTVLRYIGNILRSPESTFSEMQ